MSSFKFRFSLKVTVTSVLLASGMIRLSYWQWERHIKKESYVAELSRHLEIPVTDFKEILPIKAETASEFVFRRVRVEGDYDFEHEMVLRNRRYKDSPGVFVLTPLKLKDSADVVMVSRGFLPLSFSAREYRKRFQRDSHDPFVGLIKEGSQRRWLAPSDPPTGAGHPWVDAWLRVDLEKMSQQLPYKILPIYIEVMGDESSAQAEKQILTSQSGKEDIFNLASRIEGPKHIKDEELENYPIPLFDTVIPPARHLGYVYEWAIMAFMTLLIGIVLQLRRPKPASNS